MAINFTWEEWAAHISNHKILAVDDEDIKLGHVMGIAWANGFGCDFARSASEAWGKLLSGKTKYELMVTDNSMPKQNVGADGYDYSSADGLDLLEAKARESGNEGLQLIRRIRQNPALRGLEIVIYTGSDVRQQAEALGAQYIQRELYVLNEILRERSELYKAAAQNPTKIQKE